MTQGLNADLHAHKFNLVTPQVGDLMLLNTEHYNLMLPSQKLAPKWIGPLRVEEVRGPNTVSIQVPPSLGWIKPLQNIAHLKPYVSRPTDICPTHVPDGPELVDGEEEFVVEEILAHRGSDRRTQYLVLWASYWPEDDLWLPTRNLANAQPRQR
eukprot:42489-Rhodomonas_salina.1